VGEPAVGSVPFPSELESFVADPGGVGVFCDFDGTLAPIVDEPAAAVPLPGVVEALEALAARVGRVAVISGRPVAFLQRFFPDSPVMLSGLYGLEEVVHGEVRLAPGAGAWREAVDDVVAAAASGAPPGMYAEHKGLSVTLHFREHPEIADDVADWARVQATRSGLELRWARMSVELHPPVGTDKGSVLEALAEGLGCVCFLGDDVGDLPAFGALDRMRADGRSVAKVVVASSEMAPAVAAAADVTVDGPAEALELLRSFTARLSA
jgi:trehalose 6-phosphate phosphatase